MPGEEKLYIKKIKLSDGSVRWVKDEEARAAIASEIERAGQVESNLQADIVNNHDAIVAEKTRAEGVEGSLQAQITAIVDAGVKVKDGEKIIGLDATTHELTSTLGVKIEKKSDNKDYIVITGIDNAEVASVDASAFVKDGMIENVELSKHDNKTFIKITFNTEAGKQPIELDVTELIDVYTAGNGINVTGNVITAVAKSGDKYIEVTSAGIASKGIDAAIKVETDRAEAAEEAINNKIGTETDEPTADTVYGDIKGLSNRLTTEENDRSSADAALSNRITTIEGKEAGWDAKQDALAFDGTYNASTNKVATVSTVTSAIEGLDVTNISGFGAGKTLATLTETDGKISATFQDISITLDKVSDVSITAGELNGYETRITSLEGRADGNDIAISNLEDNKLDNVKLGNDFITVQSDATHGNYVDLGNIATTESVVANVTYNTTTHKLSQTKGNTTTEVHTFGALADKSSVSGTASITHTPTDITLNGTFTPTGTVAVTLKNAGVLSSVATAGTLPTYAHTGFSGGSLGTESKSKFATKVINARIDSTDNECLEFFEEANTNTAFYSDAVTAQGTFTPATYGTDTFTQGAMPTFNSGTVAVNSATFTGTADQAISTSGQYSKADATASVTAD